MIINNDFLFIFSDTSTKNLSLCPIYFSESPKPAEDKTKSGLDALSLICQAVLLDHNYNATLPPDSPTRPSPPNVMSAQVNGVSPGSVYSPNTIKSEFIIDHVI